jgi:hypothetical protein
LVSIHGDSRLSLLNEILTFLGTIFIFLNYPAHGLCDVFLSRPACKKPKLEPGAETMFANGDILHRERSLMDVAHSTDGVPLPKQKGQRRKSAKSKPKAGDESAIAADGVEGPPDASAASARPDQTTANGGSAKTEPLLQMNGCDGTAAGTGLPQVKRKPQWKGYVLVDEAAVPEAHVEPAVDMNAPRVSRSGRAPLDGCTPKKRRPRSEAQANDSGGATARTLFFIWRRPLSYGLPGQVK